MEKDPRQLGPRAAGCGTLKPMGVHGTIRTAELELLASSTRADAARLRRLLHPEFLEIGRSGQRWTREDIIAALGAEDQRPTPETDEWEFSQLAPHLFLVTYRIRSGTPLDSGTPRSRHASVWDTSTGQPRLRFHQGTPVLRGN